jgi:hypothetical protein
VKSQAGVEELLAQAPFDALLQEYGRNRWSYGSGFSGYHAGGFIIHNLGRQFPCAQETYIRDCLHVAEYPHPFRAVEVELDMNLFYPQRWRLYRALETTNQEGLLVDPRQSRYQFRLQAETDI